MAEMNEDHFETIDANRDKAFQEKQKTRTIIKELLIKHSKRELIEIIEKEIK